MGAARVAKAHLTYLPACSSPVALLLLLSLLWSGRQHPYALSDNSGWRTSHVILRFDELQRKEQI